MALKMLFRFKDNKFKVIFLFGEGHKVLRLASFMLSSSNLSLCVAMGMHSRRVGIEVL